MKTARRRRLLTAQLREEAVRGFAPLKESEKRVDRDKGIIRGCKVVGRSSPNTHGVRGVDGTEYTMEALTRAVKLYEGVNCNVDHPPREKPQQERSALDRFAWIENCVVQESGIYGDLHFLDPTDPLAVKMMAAAEAKPDAYALSHNAVGKGSVQDGKYVVTEIPEVRSVDIVADGGTNRSLFEGRSMLKKTSLRKIITESNTLTPATKKRLLEMGKSCGEALDKEYEKDEKEEGVRESEEEDGQQEPGWKDHVTNAVGALVKSEDPADHDKAGKLMKHLRPDEAKEEEEEEEEDLKEEEENETLGDEEQDARGEPEKKKGEANTKDNAKGKESMESRQRRVKAMCELADVEADKDLIEALAPLTTTGAAKVLKKMKSAGAGTKKNNAPRSASAHSVLRPVREGAPPPDAKTTAQRWLRN